MTKFSSKSLSMTATTDSMSAASESRSASRGSGGGGSSGKHSVIVYLDENGNQCKEPRVRRVVGTQARHVTVTNFSRRHRESHSRTQHFVTSIRCVYKRR